MRIRQQTILGMTIAIIAVVTFAPVSGHTSGSIHAQSAPAPAPAQRGRGPNGRGTTPPLSNGECPAGMTLVRVGTCQAPEFLPPSIVDYRPRSTLITETHPVPRAKYPVIDVHGHPGNLITTVDNVKQLVADMDKLNVRVMISADNSSGQALSTRMAAINGSPYKDRVRVLTGVNFANVGPGWAEKAITQLEADLKAGAIGIGE